MAEARTNVIYLCAHCGNRKLTNSLLCKRCATPKQRREQDDENRAIWVAQGKEFHCHYCENETEIRDEAKRFEAAKKITD